jgi:phosphatidylglycerol---prolipoprotein diacylglyceryl transferase
MTGIVINLDPVALAIGPVAIRWFGLTLALALVVELCVGLREGRRKGIDADEVIAVAFWAIICGVVVARLFHALDELDYYLRHPLEVLSIYEGGLSMWGGMAGGFLGGYVYVRRHALGLGPIADAAAPALLAGQIVGRLGCIVNGDAYGRIADVPWAFTYIHPAALIPMLGLPTHPYPVYEIAWNAVALAGLWRLRTRTRIDGVVFLAYVVLYSVGRLVLGFFRQEDLLALGLSPAQIASIVALLAAAAWAWRLFRRESASRLANPSQSAA